MKFKYFLFFVSLLMLVSSGVFSQVRPDHFPVEETPDDTNFEVYSQKNGVNTKATVSSLKYGINPRIIPITYVPATAGNSENHGTFVKDPNGNTWYVDHLGMAVALGSGGSNDTNTQVEDIRVVGNNLVYDIVNKITGATLDSESIPLVNFGLQSITAGQGLDVETTDGITDIQVVLDPDNSNVLTKSNLGLKVELPPAQADTDWIFNTASNTLHNSITDNARVGINKSDPFFNLDINGNLGIRTGDGGLHFRRPSNNGAYSNFLLSSVGLRIENSNEFSITDENASPSFKIDFPNNEIRMYDDVFINKKIIDSQGSTNDGTQILSSDANGNILWVEAMPTVPNIYTEDGTIDENRSIQLDDNFFRIKNGAWNLLNVVPSSQYVELRGVNTISAYARFVGNDVFISSPLTGTRLESAHTVGSNNINNSLIDYPYMGIVNHVGNSQELRGFAVDSLENLYIRPEDFDSPLTNGALLQKQNTDGEVLFTEYRLPSDDGAENQALRTNGNGEVTWENTVFVDAQGSAGVNTDTPQATMDIVGTRGLLVPRLWATEYANWEASFNTTTDVTGFGGAGNESTSRQGELVYDLDNSSLTIAIWSGSAWIFQQLN